MQLIAFDGTIILNAQFQMRKDPPVYIFSSRLTNNRIKMPINLSQEPEIEPLSKLPTQQPIVLEGRLRIYYVVYLPIDKMSRWYQSKRLID
jgi:hypothetical protein